MKKYVKALTIAGSDSSGGAGIQADLKTFAALGCYGMSAITALTAQNTLGVQAVYPVSPDFIEQQLKSILMDIGTDVIKIGMLHSTDLITTVTKLLSQYLGLPIVIDPVMVAKGGSLLLEVNAIDHLKHILFPMATVITPNLYEAEHLLQMTINTREKMQQAAQLLSQLGPKAVLVKGGHLDDEEAADCLYITADDSFHWLATPRIITQNTHGTGCTLSSAIAAYLAQGGSLLSSIQLAKQYITTAIVAGSQYTLGQGHGPVAHFA